MAHTEPYVSYLGGMCQVRNGVVSILGETKPAENGFKDIKDCILTDEDNGNKGEVAKIQIIPPIAVALYYKKLLNVQHFAEASGYLYQGQIFIDNFEVAGLTVTLIVVKWAEHDVCTFDANHRPLPNTPH